MAEEKQKTRIEIIAEGFGLTLEEAQRRDDENKAKRERMRQRVIAEGTETKKAEASAPAKKFKPAAAVADDAKAN